MVSLDQECWSNNQYCRHKRLEMSGFPESLNIEDLKGTAMKVFVKLEVVVDLSNVENCHWVASRTTKKVIIKLSRGKDVNKIRWKKNLKNLNSSSLGRNNPVFD